MIRNVELGVIDKKASVLPKVKTPAEIKVNKRASNTHKCIIRIKESTLPAWGTFSPNDMFVMYSTFDLCKTLYCKKYDDVNRTALSILLTISSLSSPSIEIGTKTLEPTKRPLSMNDLFYLMPYISNGSLRRNLNDLGSKRIIFNIKHQNASGRPRNGYSITPAGYKIVNAFCRFYEQYLNDCLKK